MQLNLSEADIASLFNEGVQAHNAGDLSRAERLYQETLSIQPGHCEANHNIGVVLVAKNELDKALEFFKFALDASPNVSLFWASYIDTLIKLERIGESKTLVKAVKQAGISCDKIEALSLQLNILYQEPEAKVCQESDELIEQKKFDDAIKICLRLSESYPSSAILNTNLGQCYLELGQIDQAISSYKKATEYQPQWETGFALLGQTYSLQGKVDEAIKEYKKALCLKPDFSEAYYNLGVALQKQGKLEEAIVAYTKLLSLKPNHAKAYNNMANALKDQGKPEEAIKAYRNLLSITPDCAEGHKNLSFALLNSGRLKEGFEEYEWRWKVTKNVTKKREFSKPLWDGKEILKGKKVLLWCEQGVGDTINWSSRLPLIVSQADHCILECQEKLVPLLTQAFPNVEIKAEDRRHDSQRDDFDFHLPMGSLYRHFISEILENAKPDAFLIPEPVRIKFWRKRLESLGNGPFIGISWKSADMSPERLPHYAPISDWSPIFRVPNVTFVNLQYVDFSDDLTTVRNDFGVTIHNFDELDHYNNLADVAALCAALDMVVSTKITVPLISAGVGTLTKLANWRQSSWNNFLLNPVGPFVDIFERNTWETWDNVFSEIAQDIVELQNKMHVNSGGD